MRAANAASLAFLVDLSRSDSGGVILNLDNKIKAFIMAYKAICAFRL